MAALKMLTNAVLNSGQAGRNDSVLEHFSKPQQQNTSINQQTYSFGFVFNFVLSFQYI